MRISRAKALREPANLQLSLNNPLLLQLLQLLAGRKKLTLGTCPAWQTTGKGRAAVLLSKLGHASF